LVNQTYINKEYTYSEDSVTKTINGFFVPIFSNHGRPLGNDRNEFYKNKMKEITKLIDTNPYSYIFDGGYIKAPVLRLGISQDRIEVIHKKPSLNTAIEGFSYKNLAKEFWHTLQWDGMSDTLKTPSEQPLLKA
jgi:hypothetical protein